MARASSQSPSVLNAMASASFVIAPLMNKNMGVKATSAAALQNFTTISGSHTRAEAVHAQAAMDLRLISPLSRH